MPEEGEHRHRGSVVCLALAYERVVFEEVLFLRCYEGGVLAPYELYGRETEYLHRPLPLAQS